MRRHHTIISNTFRIVHELKHHQTICIQFGMYACSMILTRALSLLCAPISMYLLSPEDYGLLALANGFISVLTACIGAGLRQALPLYYFRSTESAQHLLLRNISLLYLAISTPVFLLAACNMSLCNRYFFLCAASNSFITLCLCISFAYFFVELCYQLLQYRQHTHTLAYVQLSAAGIALSCNLFCLWYLQWGPISIFAGQAIGMLYVLWLHRQMFFNLCKSTPIEHTSPSMRSYVRNSLPFVPSMLCGVLLTSGDRWALAHISTLHTVGIYSVANTLAQFTNMLILYALNGSYMPYLLKQFAAQPENIPLLEAKNKRIMLFCMCTAFTVLCCGFGLLKPLITLCIPTTYHEAINYMGLLLIGSIFYLGTHFLNCLIQFQQQSIFLGFALLVPSLLNIGLNMLLIPLCNIYGCVIATVISYICYFLITYLYNMRLYKNMRQQIS